MTKSLLPVLPSGEVTPVDVEEYRRSLEAYRRDCLERRDSVLRGFVPGLVVAVTAAAIGNGLIGAIGGAAIVGAPHEPLSCRGRM